MIYLKANLYLKWLGILLGNKMDIIKTIRICDTFNLSLVYFGDSKGYELQYSDDDKILDTDGMFSNKKDGLEGFKRYLNKELIRVGVTDGIDKKGR